MQNIQFNEISYWNSSYRTPTPRKKRPQRFLIHCKQSLSSETLLKSFKNDEKRQKTFFRNFHKQKLSKNSGFPEESWGAFIAEPYIGLRINPNRVIAIMCYDFFFSSEIKFRSIITVTSPPIKYIQISQPRIRNTFLP